MTALVFFCVTVLGADVSEYSYETTGEPAQLRGYVQIHNDIRDVIREDTRAKNLQQRLVAVRRMADLYGEIQTDPRLATSDTLKSHKARLWSCMTQVKKEVQKQVDREARQRARGVDAEQMAAIEEATRCLADQMSQMNYSMGGPAYVFQQGGGAFGGGAVRDHGQELIDLIQRTISPDTWDVAGGPGSMFYYQPLMALVVSATSEVHGNVGGLLGALRRAGQ